MYEILHNPNFSNNFKMFFEYGINQKSKDLYLFWNENGSAEFLKGGNDMEYLQATYTNVRQQFFFDKNKICKKTIIWFNDTKILYSILDDLKIKESEKSQNIYHNNKPLNVLVFKQMDRGKLLYSVSLTNKHK